MITRFALQQAEYDTVEWTHSLDADYWWNGLPDGYVGQVDPPSPPVMPSLYANSFSSRELAESVATVMLRHRDALRELADR